jgi:hypothetical protein
VRPVNILAVTFTNKAAGEMRGRVLKLLGQDPNNRNYFPFIGTFHGICLRLLRREATEIGLSSNFIVFDAGDAQSAIKRAIGLCHKSRSIKKSRGWVSPIAANVSSTNSASASPCPQLGEYKSLSSRPTFQSPINGSGCSATLRLYHALSRALAVRRANRPPRRGLHAKLLAGPWWNESTNY